MKKSLPLALRDKIFPRPEKVVQSYPFNKNYLLFFLGEMMEEEEDLDDEDKKVLGKFLEKVSQKNWELSADYREFYNGVFEGEFRAKAQGQFCEEECREWANQEIPQLAAAKRTGELMVFDLFTSKV